MTYYVWQLAVPGLYRTVLLKCSMPVWYPILGAIYGFVIDCGLPSINEFGNIYAHADDLEDKQ